VLRRPPAAARRPGAPAVRLERRPRRDRGLASHRSVVSAFRPRKFFGAVLPGRRSPSLRGAGLLARRMLLQVNQSKRTQEATMQRRELLVTDGAGLAVGALPLSCGFAYDVKFQGFALGSAAVTPAPAPSPMTRADRLEAQQIRADPVYANKIDADNIQGQIHQSKDVKVGDTRGDIQAPGGDRLCHLRRRDLREFHRGAECLRAGAAPAVIAGAIPAPVA